MQSCWKKRHHRSTNPLSSNGPKHVFGFSGYSGFSKKKKVHKYLFSDTSEQSSCSEESPEHQTEGDCAAEKEASEAPQVSEEQRTEEHESKVSHISENVLNSTEPERKGHRLLKIRRNYTFKQSIENLHSGRPAYSSADLNPRESIKSPVRVDTLSSGIRLPAGKCRRGGLGSPQSE